MSETITPAKIRVILRKAGFESSKALATGGRRRGRGDFVDGYHVNGRTADDLRVVYTGYAQDEADAMLDGYRAALAAAGVEMVKGPQYPHYPDGRRCLRLAV